MIIEKQSLLGAGVRLEPLSFKHQDGLVTIVRKGDLWKKKETLIPHPEKMQTYIKDAINAYRRREELVFAIIDTTTQQIAGCSRFRRINVAHKKAIIGPTFIGVDFQRTHVNTETKYLMLAHAFETWRLNRIELICDVLNIPSRNAIKRIGAKEEGIIRNHLIMPDGRIRDSVLHSIILEDWPQVKAKLEDKRQQYNYLMSA